MIARLPRLAPLAVVLLAVPACVGDDSAEALLGPERGKPRLSTQLAHDSLPADGAFTTEFTILVENRGPDGPNTALVSVTAGKLIGADSAVGSLRVPLDESGSGLIRVRSPSAPASAVLYVQYADITAVDSLAFFAALPDRIYVEPERFALTAGADQKMTISTKLFRETGLVSAGREVAVVVRDTAGTQVGEVLGAGLSDASGSTTFSFTAGPTAYDGPAAIIAQTAGRSGAIIADTAGIWIEQPGGESSHNQE